MTRINRHCSYEEKKLILEEYLLSGKYEGMRPKEFSAICKVNYRTLMRWGTRIDWDASRIEELKRKGKKKGVAAVAGSNLSEGEQKKILEVAAANQTWGPLKIKQYLWRHEQILLPQTSIYRYMKSQGLVKEREKGEKEEGHTRRFEYPSPLAGVQMDLMYVKLSSAMTIYLVTLLDDFSRFVLVSRFVAVKTMDEVIDILKEAVRSYGVMDCLLTDYGSEYVSWQRFTRFEALLCDLDVKYIASGPNKKENQGKLERWHQTVRQELRQRGPLDYSHEAQLWIRDLQNRYNYERPHQGIGGLVPADRFFGMHEEIEAELARCRRNENRERQIYFVCRVGERKLVVSGQRQEELSVLMDGKPVEENTSLKNSVGKKISRGQK
ncbi:MAG: transposase family protein [Gammaproteobacteria bacterium]|nr:transposase family protein [Gammaproteobacteria bacterium]